MFPFDCFLFLPLFFMFLVVVIIAKMLLMLLCFGNYYGIMLQNVVFLFEL